jgi:hypothetical protein
MGSFSPQNTEIAPTTATMETARISETARCVKPSDRPKDANRFEGSLIKNLLFEFKE